MVYTILDYFLSDHTQGLYEGNGRIMLRIDNLFAAVCMYVAVKEMGSEFVLGYIQAMDGEKDPRNLAIALNSVHRMVLYLPFGEPETRS